MDENGASDRPVTAAAQSPARRPLPLWMWFAVGFVLTFFGMALFCTTFVMKPTGDALVRCSLLEYYLHSLRQLSGAQLLGPGMSSFSDLLGTLLGHIMFSTIGGAALAAVGAVARRVERRRGRRIVRRE